MNSTKMLLPVLFAAMLLTGCTGRPGKGQDEPPVAQAQNAQMQTSSAAVDAEPGPSEVQKAVPEAHASSGVNQPDEQGRTPLMRAAEAHQLERVKALIHAGADVNAKSGCGGTALTEAMNNDDDKMVLQEIVKQLIKAGADVNAAPDSGRTALMSAVAKNDLFIMKALIHAGAGASVNAQDSSGQTALMLAAGRGSPEMITDLLAAGADVKAKADDLDGKRTKTALHYAAEDNSDSGGSIVKQLVEAGADVNEAVDVGRTPLTLLMSMMNNDREKGEISLEQLEIGAAALIKAGANVNAATKSGETALMIAAGACSTEMVTMLIKAGANVNAKGRDGDTALMWAASCEPGASDVVKLLIDAKADVNAKDKNGRKAYDLAESDAAAELLKKAGTRGCDPKRPYARKMALLREARAGNADNPEAVKALIAAGTDVNARDDVNGETPLLAAAGSDNPDLDMMKALIAAGADVNAKDRNGETALMRAVSSHDSNAPYVTHIVEALIHAGADVNAADRHGWTALRAAVSHYHSDVVE